MTAPFVILGTPRSRTAWIAKFLAFEGRKVLHEPSIEFRSINDLYALLADRSVAGIVDSALTFRWRDVLTAAPAARIVVVHRPSDGVIASYMRTGAFDGHRGAAQVRLVTMMRKFEEAIDEFMQDAAFLYVPSTALASETIADQVFRYCLREPLPPEWWDRWRNVNIQADIRDVFRRAAANADGVRAVFPELTGIE